MNRWFSFAKALFKYSPRLNANFPRKWYLQDNPDLRQTVLDPLDHYIRFGAREGRDPTPWFSTQAYLELNPDISDTGANPFEHYLRHGMKEGRAIHPTPTFQPSLQEPQQNSGTDAPGGKLSNVTPPSLDELEKVIAPHFDEPFYRGQMSDLPDELQLGEPNQSLLQHYLTIGWSQGLDPTHWFSVKSYLHTYEQARNWGADPFCHYLLKGAELGFRPRPGAPIYRPRIAPETPTTQHLPHMENGKPERATRIIWAFAKFDPKSEILQSAVAHIRCLEIAGYDCVLWFEKPGGLSEVDIYDLIVKRMDTVMADIVLGPSPALSVSQHGCVVLAGSLFESYDHLLKGAGSVFHWYGALGDSRSALPNPIAAPRFQEKKIEAWHAHSDLPCVVISADILQDETQATVVCAALELAQQNGCQFELHLINPSHLDVRLPRNLSTYVHDADDRDARYNIFEQSTLGLTAHGSQRLVSQMLAAGLPVIIAHTFADRPPASDGVIWADHEAQALSDTIVSLLEDPARLGTARQSVQAWRQRHLPEAQLAALQERLALAPIDQEHNSAASISVDIIIPTYNGMQELPAVIDAIRAQQAPFPFQIICVDSSSTDGTTQWLQQQDDIVT
ncbi:MAG: glycosyltransferase, partial [Pseudomonadota bacterium]